MSSSSPDVVVHGSSSSPAETPPPTTASPSGLPAIGARAAARSCYGCNQKKIRCDKKLPCTACSRSSRVCEYPPAGPRIRRAKRTIIADMSSRIHELEKTLTLVRESKAHEAESAVASGHPVVKNALYSGHLGHRSRDILIEKGSESQYFNEILLSRVIKEEQDIESALTPQRVLSTPEPPSPFNALGILSSPSPSLPPASFHPPDHSAVRLWNIYMENVEACAGLKLLHQPTDELRVFSVINDPSSASAEKLALAFAIYFASTVSLDAAEAKLLLGQDQHTALLQFKLGLEQAFAHGDFLDRPTIAGLNALSIYVAALRCHNRGKGIWILNGLAIRIAQSLGLHRDGKRLGLSPFQSEIRRRLWWHLLSRDSRAGEDYGLENTNSPLLLSDVDLPANVHDTDLHPDMKEPPVPRTNTWTAMTFSLINVDISKTMQTLAATAAASSPTSPPPSEELRAKSMAELRERVQNLLAPCNPLIPQQRLTLQCSRFLLSKLDFVTRLQWILLRQRRGAGNSLPDDAPDFATDAHLHEAVALLEPRLVVQDGLLAQFSWPRRAYPQYHIMLYVLLHLCVRPEGDDVERAWVCVDGFFEDELRDEATIGFGSKLSVLAALRRKAILAREKLLRRSIGGGRAAGSTVESGTAVAGEQTVREDGDGGENDGGHLQGEAVGEVFEGLAGEGGMVDWPDWAALVQDFQLGSSEMFLQ